MRALKALVIFMGIAILVGVSVLATLIFERGRQLAETPPAATPGAPADTTPAPALRLALPGGARVVETRIDGGRVILRATLGTGGEAVFVFDAASGRALARYDISPEGGR